MQKLANVEMLIFFLLKISCGGAMLLRIVVDNFGFLAHYLDPNALCVFSVFCPVTVRETRTSDKLRTSLQGNCYWYKLRHFNIVKI